MQSVATITGPNRQEWAAVSQDIARKGFQYRTDPSIYRVMGTLLDAAFDSPDDPARDIARDFWLYGFVHLAPRVDPDAQGRVVYIFDPRRSRIETVKVGEQSTQQLCATEFTFNAGMGSRMSFEPGQYIRLELDREKCPQLPTLGGDGELGAEAVPWLEEWLRASEELATFVRSFAR